MLNARSLLNKIDELQILVANFSPDVVAITETWLSADVSDQFMNLTDYILFRSDREERLGGGVCLYIREHFKPERVQQLLFEGIESISVRLPLLNIIIWCIYIPPNLSTGLHNSLFESITHLVDNFFEHFPSSRITCIFCGDFNDFRTKCFHTNFSLVNKVTTATRETALLDQIWISEDLGDRYDDAEVGPPLATSDHNCVFLRSSSSIEHKISERKTVFDYRRSHIDAFLRVLSSSDFGNVYNAETVNDKCTSFYKIFFEALSQIPCREVIITNKDKPWITPLLKKLIDDRWFAYRTRNWPVYNHLKDKVKAEVYKAKKTWSDRLVKNGGNLWNVVRELQGKPKRSVGTTGDEDTFNLLNRLTESFKLCFNAHGDDNLCDFEDEIWNFSVDEMDVYHALKKLKFKQSKGYDGIDARLLWESAEFICQPLAHIYRSSVSSRCFPDFWKNAYICPVPKKINPSVNDYRQISLLPIISKIFERLILSSVRASFINLFGMSQHAFRPSGSTTGSLIEIHDSVTSFMENSDNLYVRLTCLDFSKAFDRVLHNRLINILVEKGLNKGFLVWLTSYLKDRFQRVVLNGCIGPLMKVQSGVPQGSVMGPYLFGVFMSTLHIVSQNGRVVKFADDVTLIESCTRTDPNPNNLSLIQDWSHDNKMELNKAKSCQMLFLRAKEVSPVPYPEIEVVNSVNILGVIVNDKLTWDDHFESVILRASRRLHVLRSLKPFVTKQQLVDVFYGFIMSIVMYATPVFCKLSSVDICKLVRLRKRAHRIICSAECECDIVPDLIRAHEVLSIKYFKRCFSPNHPLRHLVPKRLPRSGRYQIQFCSTSRRLNSFFPHMSLFANLKDTNIL